MLEGLVLILIFLVIVPLCMLAYHKYQAKKLRTAGRTEYARPAYGLQDLKPGDIIEWRDAGRRCTIQGQMRLDQGDYVWTEYYIDPIDGKRRHVSIVDQGGVFEFYSWRRLMDADITPGDDKIIWAGVVYTLEECGKAYYRTRGAVNVPSSGTIAYYDYRSAEGEWLYFKQLPDVDGRWEVNLGWQMHANDLVIYPAAS